jgi:Glycosyl hydrolases family 32 N-terminal domain
VPLTIGIIGAIRLPAHRVLQKPHLVRGPRLLPNPASKLIRRLMWFGLLCVLAPWPAQASYMLPPVGYRAKDFSIIKHDGLYHLFYTRRNTSLPPESTTVDLGHAVSSDLISWTQFPGVLQARPGKWDNAHIWAPTVIEHEGVFYMFYTGVSSIPGVHNDYQQIGIATSTDLFQWTRLDQPLLTCADVPWAYCDPLQSITSFRDPFVMADPAVPGHWLMYYATSLAADSAQMIAGLAGSDALDGRDALDVGWADAGSLAVTHVNITYSDLMESPHLFDHAGRWFMLWTTNQPQPIYWATNPDPVGPLATWTYRGSLSSMLGYDTSPWFASEYLRDGKVDYFAVASLAAIEILRIAWTSDTTFALVQPTPFHVRSLTWSKPVVDEGDTASLTIDAVNWFGKSATLEVVEVDGDGTESIVPNFQVGLPSQIPLTGSTTVFTWTAHAYPDGGDGPDNAAELVVRLPDQTAIAPMIQVWPHPHPSGEPPPDPDPDGGYLLLFLRRSPLGAAFRVQLPGAAAARLELFDVNGRRVRTVLDGELHAGVNVVRFDPRAAGIHQGPGMYFARLVTPFGTRVARVAWMP